MKTRWIFTEGKVLRTRNPSVVKFYQNIDYKAVILSFNGLMRAEKASSPQCYECDKVSTERCACGSYVCDDHKMEKHSCTVFGEQQ